MAIEQEQPQEPTTREAQSQMPRGAPEERQEATQQQKKPTSFLKEHATEIAFLGALTATGGLAISIPFLAS